MGFSCRVCDAPANYRREWDDSLLCWRCFTRVFERQVYESIKDLSTFQPGSRVVIGVSGGKDSTALLHCLNEINHRYSMGLDLYMVAIDEGIKGYRDLSLDVVEELRQIYQLPCFIYSYRKLFGLDLDDIAKIVGNRMMCSFCGPLRRSALVTGYNDANGTCLVTGHNASDISETVSLNLLKSDAKRLVRAARVQTVGTDGIHRVKPFIALPQVEVVLYGRCAANHSNTIRHKGPLPVFNVECTYAGPSFRGVARASLFRSGEGRPGAKATSTDHAVTPGLIRFSEIVDHIVGEGVPGGQKTTNCARCGMLVILKEGLSENEQMCQKCKLEIVLRKPASQLTKENLMSVFK